MPMTESLGKYLKRLREDRQLSLREAAKRAGVSSGYLSQVEGEKRGRRKGGQVFAPHPEMIKNLARVYHVPAAELLERAGYLGPQEQHYGFYEDVEVNRCFEFVLRDPVLKEVLTTDEKKAIVHRYETLTNRKLITWAGDDSVVNKKATHTGLRAEGGLLYATRTTDEMLTEEEVRQELRISADELKHYVAQKTLRPVKASKDKMLFEGSAVLSLRRAWLDVGRDVLSVTKHRPRTEEEFQQAIEEVRQHRLSAPKAVKSRERIEELQRALEQQDQEIKR